jgi:superfamily II DNA or RNA helicase
MAQSQQVPAELFTGVDVELRDYQLRIIGKAVRMFAGTHADRHGEVEPAAASVMIESPTGSGKTVMGLAIARHLQRTHGYKIGWVAMRRNLLSQALFENKRRNFGIEMEPISMFDKAPPPVDVLVVDEAQHDAAMSMANLHCMVRPKLVLGLTATPFRTDRIKLCFDKVIRDAGIQQLIQDGYLSRYRHFTLPEYTPASVAECFLRERQRWGQSLIFFHRLDQCQACHALLRAAGVRTEIVTASSDRERQLDDFEAGRLEVLINMSILTEGFDCPRLRTVFCRPSGRSCTIQMAGRVLRLHADEPRKQIVQCKRTPHPFVKTALADEQYVWTETGWNSLTLNPQIQQITQKVRGLLAKSNVELPKLLTLHRNDTAWHERLRR